MDLGVINSSILFQKFAAKSVINEVRHFVYRGDIQQNPLLLKFCLVYVRLSELIHLLVVVGWAGNFWDPLGGVEHPGPVGSGAPACPNTQPCGLCD